MRRVKAGAGVVGRTAIAAAALLLAGGGPLEASPTGVCSVPLGFAEGVAGWQAFDPADSVRRSTRPASSPPSGEAVPAGGDAVLEFRYRVRSGGVSLLAKPELDLTGCVSLSFRVRASHAGGLAFGLTERDESRYGAVTRVPAGQWTEVRVNLDELELAADSKDEDERLLPGSGFSFWLVDVAIFGQTLDPAVRGERTLWLDGVAFSAKRAPVAGRRPEPEGGTLVLDDFETGLVRWMPIAVDLASSRTSLYPADTTLDFEPRGPDPAHPTVLRVRHPQPPRSALVLARDVAGLDLRRAERVVFWARTDRPGTFLAVLEERAGARYEQAFDLPPDRWERRELRIDRFTLASDSHDANGRLDLGAIKLLSIVAARLEDGAAASQTLRLDEPGFVLR